MHWTLRVSFLKASGIPATLESENLSDETSRSEAKPQPGLRFGTIRMKLICFLCLSFCDVAAAQYQRGTVVALVTSSQGTVVAADSRNHPTHKKIDDDMCKLLTFGDKIVAAIGGVSGHESSASAGNWDGFKQLRVAYAKKASSTHAFAAEWASEMHALILRDVSARPIPLIRAMPSWDGSKGVVMDAIFVGPDDLEGFAIRISLVKLANGYDVRQEELRHPPGDCDFVCAGVNPEIIEEIRLGKTTRAIGWRDAMSRMSATERAIEAVRLTIENSSEQINVGGPIDARFGFE